MSKPSLTGFRSGFGLVLLAVAAGAILALPAFADSQARIVRLSDVRGSVRIDKNTGVGFESAVLNLPITQGTQLKTLDNGRAEVEFEDGSTLRLTPNTTIRFSTLGATDAGKHVSTVNLVEGMAYVNWLGKSGDRFTLDFSREKLILDREAHFRVDASTDVADLAVFKGDVNVDGPSGTVAVTKKKTATFSAVDDKSTLASNITAAPLDSWDKDAVEYHEQYLAKNSPSPYGYGLSDLNYYGAYNNIPGYGMMWQPYFIGAGWDPFMDGAWSWYPGYGYMFASAYPWGWLPFRYGNWISIPGYGWMWQPGGWNSWMAVPHYAGVLSHPLVVPTGTVRTIAVGKGGPVLATPLSRMVVHSGSAGLGIARGSVKNLRHLNGEVAKNGYVEMRPTPQFAASSPRGPAFGASHSNPGFGEPHGSVAAAPRAPSAPHAASGAHR
jgi:Family of unknown function (DUF6600)/FecR protein